MSADNAAAAGYRANLSMVEAMMQECEYEYTSKARLRLIAESALATLHAVYTMTVEAEATQLASTESVGLIVSAHEGLVAP